MRIAAFYSCDLQLRDAVKDCQMKDSSDVFLLKWLTARNFDPVQAEKMLRNVSHLTSLTLRND